MDRWRQTSHFTVARSVSTAFIVFAVGKMPSTVAQYHNRNHWSEYQFEASYSWASGEWLCMKLRASSLAASRIFSALLVDPSLYTGSLGEPKGKSTWLAETNGEAIELSVST